MANKEKQDKSGKQTQNEKEEKKKKTSREDAKIAPGYGNLLTGTPQVGDPPVPNRAWTEMRMGRDIDELSEEEKADLYLGRDNFF